MSKIINKTDVYGEWLVLEENIKIPIFVSISEDFLTFSHDINDDYVEIDRNSLVLDDSGLYFENIHARWVLDTSSSTTTCLVWVNGDSQKRWLRLPDDYEIEDNISFKLRIKCW